jgi:O-antigen ligase
MLYIVKAVKKQKIIIGWILLLLCSYIIISNASRGAFLALVAGFILFLWYYFKNIKSWIILVAFGIIIAFFAIRYLEDLFDFILTRFQHQGFEDVGRVELLIMSWDAFWNSNMLGVGTGNFVPIMEFEYNLDITAPHNLFLEIGVQYGLLILLGFLFLLWRIVQKSMVVGNFHSIKWFVILTMCIFLISSTINSAYLLGIHLWLFLSSLYVVVDKRYVYD